MRQKREPVPYANAAHESANSHSGNPYPRARKVLADRKLYPFADRQGALAIVHRCTAEVAKQQAREEALRAAAPVERRRKRKQRMRR